MVEKREDSNFAISDVDPQIESTRHERP